jgi:tellurite methyltransferase
VTDWNDRYRKGEHSPVEPHHLLVQAVESLAPGRALDVACGAGRHSLYLARQGWRVTAVDSSSVGLETLQTRAVAARADVDIVLADLERHEFDIESNAYDLICVFYYLQRDLFPRIQAGVRSGGNFVGVIHIVDEDPGSTPMNPVYLLEPDELRKIFSDWEIQHYREGRKGGPEHKHSDAEIIARKR